ncbi:hypothetical protein GTW98_13630 [Streptomyces sp. SID8375]|uniref:hypothetical protein n=1 Tax=unclassified Streptomyces TaxID=2593676 RepID=UPI0003623E7D|nr:MULTISPECIES: hypothetical protein [unclassified Streptomyces]MYX07832.1 hypothetical protein [Streptomyces sp. SID8375]
MTIHNELRLLPWSGPEGKPCYLSTEESGGYLSRLADNTEAVQLEVAAELLEHAVEVLSDGETGPNELRLLAMDMTGALRDVRRVAISRGHRLPPTDPPVCEEGDEGPRPSAAAFG